MRMSRQIRHLQAFVRLAVGFANRKWPKADTQNTNAAVGGASREYGGTKATKATKTPKASKQAPDVENDEDEDENEDE